MRCSEADGETPPIKSLEPYLLPALLGDSHSPEEKDAGEDDDGTRRHHGGRTSDLQRFSSKRGKVPSGTPLRCSVPVGCPHPCLVLGRPGQVWEEVFARPVIGSNLQIGVSLTVCIHWIPPEKLICLMLEKQILEQFQQNPTHCAVCPLTKSLQALVMLTQFCVTSLLAHLKSHSMW